MLDIGVIGYKNHAKKITDILRKKYNIKFIYHPSKKLRFKEFTNKIENLLETDCVFILCPSKEHFFYLNYFNKKNYKGYIFCEKIPVTTDNDLKKLSNFLNNKTYFNFNLRHSILSTYLKDDKLLGKLISINIFDLKPILSKKSMKQNWRMNFQDTLITNNLIHYLDLMINNFSKNIQNFQLISNKINKYFKIIDNFLIIFKIKKKLININLSYSCGLENLYLLYFSKGKIEINNSKIKIFYPNNKIDNKGRLKKPKIFINKKTRNIFEDSNNKSISYFMNVVKNREKFKKNEITKSIFTNKMVLSLSKKIK